MRYELSHEPITPALKIEDEGAEVLPAPTGRVSVGWRAWFCRRSVRPGNPTGLAQKEKATGLDKGRTGEPMCGRGVRFLGRDRSVLRLFLY
jgi:hypothetical protein